MRLLLSMGLKPHGRASEPLRPALRWLDTHTGVVRTAQVSLPSLPHPHEAAHAEFTGAHRCGDLLVQTTRTAVYWLRWPALTYVRHLSHPLLHDVHDALQTSQGHTVVTATGHDSVLWFDGEHLVQHDWLAGDGSDFASAYPGITDFRTVPFAHTKPHQVHPNHLVQLGDEVWVTCLHSQQLRCVSHARAPIEVPEGAPHDGRLIDGKLWVTTTDGQVLAIDPKTRARVHRFDLSALDPSPGLAGWCRAVEIVGDRLFVGMTTLRSAGPTELARRIVRGAQGVKKPTRVVEIDLGTGQIVAQHPVGNAAGGTLYAINALV